MNFKKLRNINIIRRFHGNNNHKNHEDESLSLIVDIKGGKPEFLDGYTTYIKDDLIPSDSNSKRFRKDMAHFLKREGEVLSTIDRDMVIIKGEMPSDLYEALVCPDLDVIYGVGVDPWYKSKNLPYIIIICAGVFLLFLMVAGGGGFG